MRSVDSTLPDGPTPLPEQGEIRQAVSNLKALKAYYETARTELEGIQDHNDLPPSTLPRGTIQFWSPRTNLVPNTTTTDDEDQPLLQIQDLV